MDARNFFDTPVSILGRRIPLYQRNQFGGGFGGPIKKDKTFFHAVYEQLKDNLSQPEVSTVPLAACHIASGIVDNGACGSGAPGTFTTVAPSMKALLACSLFRICREPPTITASWRACEDRRGLQGQSRFDHSFSDKDSMFARFTADNETKPSPGIIPVIVNQWDSISNFSTLSENHIFTPSLLNTVRASFSHTYINYQDGSGVAAIGPGLSFGNNPNLSPGNISIPGFSVNPSVVPLFNKQNVYLERRRLLDPGEARSEVRHLAQPLRHPHAVELLSVGTRGLSRAAIFSSPDIRWSSRYRQSIRPWRRTAITTTLRPASI